MRRSLTQSFHRIASTAWLLCAVCAVAARPLRAQTTRLPESLTDREFWELFTTWSEESGAFPSENFVSNEKTYQYVIPSLKKKLTPNGVYVGVGPEQNFTYLVNLKPRMAVIVDIRRQNAMLHLLYKAVLEASPSRGEFVSRLFSRPLPASLPRSATPTVMLAAASAVPPSDSAFDANWRAIVHRLTVAHGFALTADDLESMRHVFRVFLEAGPDISYAYHLGAPPSPTQWLVTYAQLMSLTNEDGVNLSFLASEANYAWLRSLESRNLVVPVVGDFGGPKALRAVGDYARNHGAVVTTFYVSNVEQYLFTGLGASARFYENVSTLPIDSTSAFIRSLPGPPSTPALPSGLLPSNTAGMSIRIVDSGNVRIFTATTIDSGGGEQTKRVVVPIPPPTLASTSAFVTGTAPIRDALSAFVAGRLSTYAQVSAGTRIDGWKTGPP